MREENMSSEKIEAYEAFAEEFKTGKGAAPGFEETMAFERGYDAAIVLAAHIVLSAKNANQGLEFLMESAQEAQRYGLVGSRSRELFNA